MKKRRALLRGLVTLLRRRDDWVPANPHNYGHEGGQLAKCCALTVLKTNNTRPVSSSDSLRVADGFHEAADALDRAAGRRGQKPFMTAVGWARHDQITKWNDQQRSVWPVVGLYLSALVRG